MSAPERVQERRVARRELALGRARNPVPALFLWSRAAIWAGALFAWLMFEPNRHPRADAWDEPSTHDIGTVVDIWARWDSVWIIRIAEQGYSSASQAAAFYPLYPGLVGSLGRLLLGHVVLAGSSSLSLRHTPPSSCCTRSRSSISAQTEHDAPSSTSPSSR